MHYNIFPLCKIFLLSPLANWLCSWSPFHRLQGCSSSCFWCLPSGGWDWSRGLLQASWWEGLVPALCLVELSLFPLLSRATSGVVFWHVCELSMTLVNLLLLMGGAAFLSFWLFGETCRALVPAGSGVEPEPCADRCHRGTRRHQTSSWNWNMISQLWLGTYQHHICSKRALLTTICLSTLLLQVVSVVTNSLSPHRP